MAKDDGESAMVSATEQPQWVWALYWSYVPCSLLGGLVAGLFKVVASK